MVSAYTPVSQKRVRIKKEDNVKHLFPEIRDVAKNRVSRGVEKFSLFGTYFQLNINARVICIFW